MSPHQYYEVVFDLDADAPLPLSERDDCSYTFVEMTAFVEDDGTNGPEE